MKPEIVRAVAATLICCAPGAFAQGTSTSPPVGDQITRLCEPGTTHRTGLRLVVSAVKVPVALIELC